MLKKFLSLTFSGLFVSSLAYCQYNQWKTQFSPYLVNTLTKYQNTIFLGTKSGLVTFEESKPESAVYFSGENGLSSADISSLLIDSVRNQLIVGFSNGDLQVMNLETSAFTSIPDIKLSKLYVNKSINSLSLLKNKLWIGTSFGIVEYDLAKKVFDFDVSKIMTFSSLNTVQIAFRNDTVYVATTESVFKSPLNNSNFKNPDSWKKEVFSPSISGITDLIDFNGKLYVATKSGLYKKTGNQFQPSAAGNFIRFFNSPQGLFLLKSNSLDLLKTDGSISTVKVSIPTPTDLVESSGICYVSTDLNGVLKLDSGSESYLSFNGLYLNSFPKLSLGPNGKFIGSGGNGGRGFDFSSYFDGKNHHAIKSADITEIGSGNVQNSSAFIGDDFYIGTFGKGILHVSGANTTVYGVSNSSLVGIAGDPDFAAITDILADGNGDLWTISYSPIDNKPLKVKRNNKPWTQMDSYGYQNYLFGLHKMDGQNYHWLGLLDNQQGNKVSLLVFSDNGTPANTADDKTKVLSTSDGLASNDVNDVAFDKNGAAWIATSAGLSVVYNAQYIFSGGVSIVPVYSVENEKVNSLIIDATGKIWAATPNGVLIVSSETQKIENNLTASNSGLVDNNVIKLVYQPETGIVYALTNYGISILKTTAVQTGNKTQTPKIFPNPYLIEKDSGVWIEGLSKDSKVVIMSIDGNVISKLNATQSLVAFWDGTNGRNEKVGSGIYFIYLLDKENNSASIGKVAVIR